ncbi:SubName: Full=Uncharacterized protein {ECO:0000313/EMBL:CCA68970.1} [Serendipita indica DSM 11827]|uniref:Nitrogen permease regulator 3 n=1 Tax=Serendipita indica (strain DSM 11827) TaxID=1109443 RepID=G4TCC7_SERID|nr:SubName: Full=Uncharacterized protein {ECO:0000313/EMBL:CCA68970.1} [Serendipita indica DSM 11827]CCA68970.1 hypothetical protein PIIN_02830 [Serendipita indica DSM 11827]
MSSDPSLLAILFVSSSSKGSHLVFRWPARPKAVPRLARPLPIVRQLDYAWRAAHPTDAANAEPEDKPFSLSKAHRHQDATRTYPQQSHQRSHSDIKEGSTSYVDALEIAQSPAYEWRLQEWSDPLNSFAPHAAGPIGPGGVSGAGVSGTTGGSHQRSSGGQSSSSRKKTSNISSPYSVSEHGDPDFEWVLGYRTKLLAEHLFRFDRNLCNQRFELVLEELLFLGHPVCIGDDGTWQWEQLYSDPKPKTDVEVDGETLDKKDPKNEASLKSFHFILVLDRPGPAWGGAANQTRFVDVYYEQLAVKMTAALHFEQSRDGYVERETDLLVDLMEAETYAEFEKVALQKSSLARAIRDIFVAVQGRRLAHVTVGAFELDLQMPWYHSELLLGDFDPEGAGEYSYDNERDERWDPGFGKGWRVKRLQPWNTLLFLDGWEAAAEIEPESSEMLRFREVLTPDVSFADAATLLDWDLETEVLRMAAYMIYLKKAQVSDVVHPKLLNIYVLPARLMTPLSELSAKFRASFPPTTPPLENILSAVSSAPQAFLHFVPSQDHYDLYHQILIWLLRHNALTMLHIRFRLIAAKEIKMAVYEAYQARKKRISEGDLERGRKRKPSGLGGREEQSQRSSLPDNEPPQESSKEIERNAPAQKMIIIEDPDLQSPEVEVPEPFEASLIMDPGKATRLEQLWIEEIARQRPESEARFLRVCEYFDGRTTFDEVQYRSGQKRNQFRQIVSEYDPWLLALLHP